MRRRHLLRLSLGAATCPLCTRLAQADDAHGAKAADSHAADGAHGWSYEGETGPKAWGGLASENLSCMAGQQQSPINLTGALSAEFEAPVLNWNAIALDEIVHNGHTIQVNTPEGGSMLLGEERYDLKQFHFHHRSEHLVDGKYFPLEVHFVHKSAAGPSLAVLGVFFVPGGANPALGPIWSAMPEKPGKASAATAIDAGAMVPADPACWRYQGSLTTPPCSEIVTWTVMRTPVSASQTQLDRFAELFPNNARPIQPLYRRFLLSRG